MAVTSVKIDTLEVLDYTKYSVANESLYLLEAIPPEEAVTVEMAARAAVFVRRQPSMRTMGLVIFLHRANALDRKTDYDALLPKFRTGSGLVNLDWVDGAVTRRFRFHAINVVPSAWFQRVSAELLIPDGTAAVV